MRTPTKEIVKQIAKILRDERPDYIYLRDLFKKIRDEFKIEVETQNKRLPYVPTEEELKRYYEVVWQAREMKHMVSVSCTAAVFCTRHHLLALSHSSWAALCLRLLS